MLNNKYKLTDDIFDNEINNIILPSIFPNMNIFERNILSDYVIRIINIISSCFTFDINKREQYLYQFRQNNYQDIKWLVQHLLPFISSENNPENITSLNDIYIKKKKNVNINEEEPQYLYSNIQYNRCIRNKDNYIEREFQIEDLKHNYYLLVNSIKNCANKLCVNWINLLPYTMRTYQKSILYEETAKRFINKNIRDWDPIIETSLDLSYNSMCENLNEKSRGLYIGHIYEELVDLYYSIKDNKWIIYDIYHDKKQLSMTEYIKVRFPNTYKLLLHDNNWENIDPEDKNEFLNEVDKIKNGLDINEHKKKFARGFILAFDKSFNVSNAIQEGYKSIKIQLKEKISNLDENKIDYEEDNDNDNLALKDSDKIQITNDMIKISFQSLNVKYIFDFMRESLQKLKQTWFGYVLLSQDKGDIEICGDMYLEELMCKVKMIPEKYKFYMKIDEIQIKNKNNNSEIKNLNDYLYKSEDHNMTISMKLIYNFAKSFVHYSKYDEKDAKKNIFVQLPKNWSSLNEENKKEIDERLNGLKDPLSWFVISGYIRRTKIHEEIKMESDIKFSENNMIKYTNLLIYRIIRLMIIDVVFQSLIHKGILTQFIPDKDRSEKRFFDDGNLEKVKDTKKQKEIFRQTDDNEYWTDSYHYLTSLRYKDMDKNSYLIKQDEKESYNYFSFGLKIPWYVAGAYDWIGQIGFCHHFINNRVIFITGGTGVGKSTEVPKLFMYYSKVIDGIMAPKVVCTQPRQNAVEENADRVSSTLSVPVFQNKKPTDNYYIQFKHKNKKHVQTTYYPSLKFITGDSLMLELDDPFLKKIKKVKSVNKVGIDNEEEYTMQNKYDIIMIDEAHEHKKHMDLLMTFLKLPILQNNSLRLVIVSATMDDDEPKYRRFFRDINDNRKFPLDNWISNDLYKLDRINIDRRYHIAPPGAGTRFVIDENYRPLINENDPDELYKKIKETVDEILKKSSPKDDILVFQPGVGEIMKTIEILNANTPANVLALPYHRELSDDHKKVIQKIDKERNNIKLEKTEDFASSDFTKGNNSYDNFIIIATNIAEASITITTLRYVIETGTEKANIYDYTKRSERIFKDKISESSRRQRKGRVGRTAPGEVYYLYKKGMTENNKIPYEFSRMRIDDILYRYLREKDEDKNIFSIMDFCDPNFILDIKKDEIIKDKNNLKKIIQNQYCIGDKFYSYFGNYNSYDYKNYKKPYTFYKTGTDAKTINDNNGEYFIIHPEELDLIRNINGDIIGIKNNINEGLTFKKIRKYKGIISSKKMDSFWKLLIDHMYISTNESDDDLLKTSTGNFFSKSEDLFPVFDQGLLRTMIYGLGMNCKEIIKFSALGDIIGFDLTNLFLKSDDNKSLMTLIYNKFEDNIKSDCDVIMKIVDNFHTFIKNKFKFELEELIINKRFYPINLIMGEKLFFTSEQINELFTQSRNKLSIDLMNNLNFEKIDDVIDKCSIIIKNNFIKQIGENYEFNVWCRDNYIDSNIMIKYIEHYLELLVAYLKIINKGEESYNFIINLRNKFKKIDDYYLKNKLKTSLFFGYPQNIVSKIKNTSKYLSLYTPNFNNIFTVAAFTPKNFKTFVSKINLSEYLFYLKTNSERDEILFISNIKIDDIILLSYIYSANFNLEINTEETKMKYIQNRIKKYKEAEESKKPPIEKARLSIIGNETNNSIINFYDTVNKFIKEMNLKKEKIKMNLDFTVLLDPDMKNYVSSLGYKKIEKIMDIVKK